MKSYHFANAFKLSVLVLAIFFMADNAIAKPVTEAKAVSMFFIADTTQPIIEANTTIGLLSGQRASNVAKLAAVQTEIQQVTVEKMEPHNADAANQKAQLDAVVAAGYDPYSETSVNAYNKKIDRLNTWGDSIDARRARLAPIYVDMKTREADYTQKISDLESKIKALINKYSVDCTGSTMEEIVNCWSIYFDGESKRKPLDDGSVYTGTNFFSQGVPDNATETFKTYRNKQLEDIDHKKIFVPAPEPPQKGAIERATEKVQDFFKGIMKSSQYQMRRVTNAVAAVRG